MSTLAIIVIVVVAGVLLAVVFNAVRQGQQRKQEARERWTGQAQDHRQSADANAATVKEATPKAQAHRDAAQQHAREAQEHERLARENAEQARETEERARRAGEAAARHDAEAGQIEEQVEKL